MNNKYVLITGVLGGMGKSTLNRFLSEGYIVYGFDILPLNEEIKGLKYFQVDLRDKNKINEAYEIIKQDNIKLDAIISTAGIYNLDSLIEISEDDFIKIFDINVFSIYRMNKTFLPLLKEGGKIIVVSSELAPLDPLPFTGLYAITKSTIEKYVYSLRMELQLLGYKVVLVRPGAVDTGLLDVSTNSLDKFVNNTKIYKCNASKFKSIVNNVEAKKVSPEVIGKLIYKINKKKNPKYVYSVNRNIGLLLLNILPQRLQNKIIKSILK